MTREEAIDIVVCMAYHTRPDEEDVEQAIEVLKQEPCEDCVSRKAVIDTIFEQGSVEKLEIDFVKLLLLQRAIKALPSVTPTRKKGKWIRVDRNKVKCSECEITHLIAQYPHGAIDFCPNCGRHMRGEENGND